MNYKRMPIEIESPEQLGYDKIIYNLTESSVTDAKLGDLGLANLNLSELVLAYCDHLGKKELREIIAKDAGVHPDEVLVTAGAATALFIINTTLLRAGDRIVVEYPNYGINLETPRALGAQVDLLPVTFEEGFKPSIQQIQDALKTKPKILSITVPHNPTGTVISESDLNTIVELTKKNDTILIMDETYKDMAFEDPLPVAATLGKHVLSVSSLSKTYGLPGIRIGWVICRDPVLMEKFLAAKEQIMITGSILDEEVAYQFLKRKDDFLSKIKTSIFEKRAIISEWMEKQEHLEWVKPRAGVVCFPRLKTTDANKVEEFYSVLNNEYGTWVGPGHWFEMDKRYMRIGYGWPSSDDLRKGLECVTKTLQKVFG